MGFWGSLRSMFQVPVHTKNVSEDVSYGQVREWVKSLLRTTVVESGFQLKSRDYIDFLHLQSKLFSTYPHGDGREIAELLKDTQMGVEDFLYLHEQVRRFLLDGHLNKDEHKELHVRVLGFEDFLVQSKIRSLLLLMERVQQIEEYGENIVCEKKVLDAKQQRLQYAQGVVLGKQEELDELQRDFGVQSHMSSERSTKLREEELSVSQDLIAFITVVGPLFDAYCACDGIPKGYCELISRYRTDAVSTLSKDRDLVILRLLDDILLKVERKEIGRGVDNLDFIIAEIKRIDFSRMQSDLDRVYVDLKRKPSSEGEIKYKIEDLKYRLTHFQSQVDAFELQVNAVQSRIEELHQLHVREIALFENIALKGLDKKVVIQVPAELRQN